MRTRIPALSLLVLGGLCGCTDHRSSNLSGSGNVLNFVAFETRLQIPTGVARTADAVIGELTGDGVLDMAVTDLDGTIQLQVGQVPSGFAPGRSFSVQGRPLAILPDDFDGDGSTDLAIVCDDVERADVFLNDGQGEFTSAAQFSVGPIPLATATGDLDADGNADIVVVPTGAAGVEVYLGNGDGTFQGKTILAATRGARAIGLAVADVTGDTRDDVLLCDTDENRLVMLLSQPAGLPSNEVLLAVGELPVAVAVGDLTADNVADIAVSNITGETLSIITRDGTSGTFSIHQTLGASGQPTNLAIADVTGDGVNDLLACVIGRRAISVFAGTNSGLVDEPDQVPTTGSPFRPIVADLNLDRVNDLAVFALGADVANVYFGQGPRLSGSRLHAIGGVDSPELVTAADFDADGAPEVAVAGFRTTVVQFFDARGAAGTADPELISALSVDLGLRVQNVVATDIDQDGRPDALVAVEGGVKILANTSQGGVLSFDVLPAGGLIAPSSGPFEMVGTDVNGDGDVDIGVAYWDSNRVSVLLGKQGEAFGFDAPLSLTLSGRPLGLAAADFDGDGRNELAVSRIDVATVTVVDLNDAGALVVGLNIPVGSIPNYLRTADFNRDGLADLVVSNAESDTVTMLLAQPSGSFLNVDVDAGRRPTALLSRDLNRDGFPDILVATLSGSDFRIVLGDGQGGVLRALEFPGVYTAASAALADLNGNGLQDLLIGSLFSKRLAVFKNISREE